MEPRRALAGVLVAPRRSRGGRAEQASSPIVHAEGVATPTLFVHGKSDHRVPIEEAEQMYAALQKQGVRSGMIRYPESCHGGWTPWRTLHRHWAAMHWWDRWLKNVPVS